MQQVDDKSKILFLEWLVGCLVDWLTGWLAGNFSHIVVTSIATAMMDGADLGGTFHSLADSHLMLENHLNHSLDLSSTNSPTNSFTNYLNLSSGNSSTNSSANYLNLSSNDSLDLSSSNNLNLSSTNSLDLSSTSTMDLNLDSSLTPRPSVIASAFLDNDSIRSMIRSNEERLEIDLGPNQHLPGKIKINPNWEVPKEEQDKRPKLNRKRKTTTTTKATCDDSDPESGPRRGERGSYLEMRRKNNAAVRKSINEVQIKKYNKIKR